MTIHTSWYEQYDFIHAVHHQLDSFGPRQQLGVLRIFQYRPKVAVCNRSVYLMFAKKLLVYTRL